MRFPSKSNFLPLAAPAERWLAAITPHCRRALEWRWLLPLAVAVAAHGLWLAGSRLVERPQRPAPVLRAADNTPELLRFSSQASETAALPAGLSTVNLPFESALPPPPPELDGNLPPSGNEPKPQVNVRTPTPAQRSAPAAAPARRAIAWAGVTREVPKGLPSDAATALSVASGLDGQAESATPRAHSAGEGTPQDSGKATSAKDGASKDGGSEGRGSEGGATAGASDAATPAAAALSRRHLRLSGAAEAPFRMLWDRALPASSRPESLAALPAAVELRSLPLSRVRELGLSQPHGISVVSSRGLLLLWVDDDDLWLIRKPS